MPELNDEAKAAIKDAIRIVREDKTHKMLSEIHSRTAIPPTPPTGPPPDPNAPPPPPNPDPNQPPPNPPKKGGYWGDLFAEES